MQKYRLTYPQQNIWYVEKFNKNLPLNVIAGTVEINYNFDVKICNEAINYVIKNNDSMRVKITNDEIVEQYVNDYKYKNFEVVKLKSYSNKQKLEYINNCVLVPLLFDRNELYDFKILDYGNGKGAIFMKIHHIISDAWSCSKIGTYLIDYIEKISNNENFEEKQFPSYIEYIKKEEEYTKSEKYQKDEKFWGEYLDKVKEPISLRNINTEKELLDTSAKRYNIKLTKDLNDKVNEFCKSNKISPYVLFLTVLSIYLYRIKEEKDIVLGTPTLNRSNYKEKNMLGMFVSTMPIRIKIEENISFIELAKNIEKTTLELFRHQKFPYSKILEKVRKSTDIKSNLYNIILSYQNARANIHNNDKYFTTWPFTKNITDELQIHIMDMDSTGILNINYDYKTKIFTKTQIQYLHKRIIAIIENAINNYNISIENIDIMDKEEKEMIIHKFNNTKTLYPKDSSIIQLLNDQIKQNPNKIAITDSNKDSITYKQLDEKSDKLASYILSINKTDNKIIGICMDKSINMMIGIVSILKCGFAYLPIENSYPKERVRYMLSDSKCKTILYDNACNVEIFDKNKLNLVLVESILNNDSIIKSTYNVKYDPESVAYIMYTSGTTGVPKGVCVTNRNIVRLIKNTNYIKFENNDSILQTGSIVFDASTFEYFGALLNGVTLCLIKKEELLNQVKLYENIVNRNITIMWLTAPLFNQMVDYDPSMFNTLKTLIIGGDVLSLKHVNLVKNACPNLKLINGYGPTENTTFSTYFNIDKLYNESIPIGYPISNSTCYIVDKKNRLLPIGVEGELIVGGDGVSLGYLNNIELTSSKFINNSIDDNFGKLYKTGDVAYFNNDGCIKFVGRKDFQFKIRGYRIELGEIQKNIILLDYIKDAFVLANKKDSQDYKIFVYYILEEKSKNKENDIKSDLMKKLPSYMMPNFFIEVKNIPLNQNGKVDKEKLIKDNPININEDKIISKPETSIQKRLNNIISTILKITTIDIKESLFSYGMDSLTAIKCAIEISRAFDVELSAKDLFLNNTIEKIESYIKDYNNSKKELKINSIMEYPLTDAQFGIFVETLKNKEGLLYNIPFELILEKNYDIYYVKECIKNVINAHEVLFTKFNIKDQNITQEINLREFDIDIKSKLTIKTYKELKKCFVKPFDLQNDLLFRVCICDVNDKIYILFDFHHIIFDGYSITLLLNNICNSLKENNVLNEDVSMGKKAISELEYKKSNKYKIAKEYVLSKYNKKLPITSIEYDNKSYNITNLKESNIEEIYLKEETLKFLEKYSRENNITLNNILFSLFCIMMSKYSNNSDILLGFASLGRNSIEELKSIGMFVKTIPFMFNINYNHRMREFLNSMQHDIINVLKYDEFTYKDLVNELNNKEYNKDIIKTMFIYQNIISYNEDIIKVNEIENKVAKFDLTCQAIPNIQKHNLKIKLEYNKVLYNVKTIKRFLNQYVNLIDNFNKYICSEVKLSSISIVDDNEKKLLLDKFNNTKTNYPKNMSISQVFEKQVEKYGNKIALVHNEKTISYNKLNELSNKFARYLKEEKKICKNDVISIISNKSIELFICILGIIKSGACYLPIDANLPEERIKYMIENSNSNVIINCSKSKITYIEDVINYTKVNLENYDISNLKNVNLQNDRAYIMYTSGSTGKPKGCINTHRGVIKLVKNINYLNLNNVENVFLSGNLVFDASLHEMWISLLNGKTGILINKEEVLTPKKYKYYFDKYKNILVIFTTQLFHQYAQNIPELFKNANYVLCGGDVLQRKYVNKVKKICENTDIINIYGPAECSAAATTYSVDNILDNTVIPIGKPISNTKCYVLDEYLNLCPINVSGNLYIGGDGVGLGYINNSKLTNEVFIDNKFDKSSEKIYNTGDIAKWNNDGILEFLGRKDKQVKIRGYRVEVSEIEKIVLENENVQEVKVAIKQVNEYKRLLMYFVAKNKINIDNLKQEISKKLPSYMIPDHIMQIDKMPLNQNGKIDEKELLNITENKENKKILKPVNELELKLEKIVCKILGIKECSVDENLFNIGFDSINITRFCIEAMNESINITYSDVFENPTIKQLANLLNYGEEKKTNYEIADYNYTKIEKVLSKDRLLVKSNLQDILLTGVNGFLGVHVLAEFLDKCESVVYCIVRKVSEKTAEERLKSIMNYYFKDKYDMYFGTRIRVIDIELSGNKFEDLINDLIPHTKINTIINCAARVKHFGKKEEFYKLNVVTVQKLINIALKNNIKLIHISTLSVSGNGIEGGFTSQKLEKEINFTEKDLYVGQKISNVYSYSKFLAEREILENIADKNLNATIIRVGNLMGRYSDGKFQRNKNENAFIDRLKFLLDYKIIPKNIVEKNYLELSPVDLTAKAIIELSKYKICNYIYHLYNYNHYSIQDFIKYLKIKRNIDVEILSDEEFYNRLNSNIRNNVDFNLTILSDLNSSNKLDYSSNVHIKHDITQNMLNEIGFKWNIIDYEYLNEFLNELNIRKIIRSEKNNE